MLYACLLLYLTLLYVRPAEIVPSWATIPFVDILTGASLMVGLVAVAAKPRKLLDLPHDKLLLAFWAVIAISSRKVWMMGVYYSWLAFTPPVFCYFLLRAAVQTTRQFRGVIYLLIALNVFLAVNGIIQYQTGVGLGNVTMKLDRIYGLGIFNDPNDLGMSFVMVVPFLTMILGNRELGMTAKSLSGVALALVLLAIFYTNSRGALLGVGAALVCASYLKTKSVRSLVFAALLAGVISIAGPSRAGEISSSEESAQSRVQAWAEGWTMLKMYPLTGVGYDQFTEYHRQVAHNSFVHTFAELGLAGAFCFVGMFYWLFKGLTLAGRTSGDLTPWTRALTASAAGVLTCMWFLSRQYVVVLYAFLALGATAFSLRNATDQVKIAMTSRDAINIGVLTFGGLVLVYLSIRFLAVWGG
jgi:putative inorganic carbon (HCO3(-)) transporter